MCAVGSTKGVGRSFLYFFFPLPESNLREGCSRSPVLSGILPGCVLRHNCVFAPGRNWAWSSSGCSECPDNGLRHFAGTEEPSSTMMTSKSLKLCRVRLCKNSSTSSGGCIRNDNGISHVSVSFYRVTWEMMLQRYVFYLVIGCCFAAHSDCYFLCTSFFAKFKNENYLSRCHITGI